MGRDGGGGGGVKGSKNGRSDNQPVSRRRWFIRAMIIYVLLFDAISHH